MNLSKLHHKKLRKADGNSGAGKSSRGLDSSFSSIDKKSWGLDQDNSRKFKIGNSSISSKERQNSN